MALLQIVLASLWRRWWAVRITLPAQNVTGRPVVTPGLFECYAYQPLTPSSNPHDILYATSSIRAVKYPTARSALL